MGHERERSDEELARSARDGDVEAFDVLVRRYLRPTMALAWQFVRSVEDAEDVVQEGFHRAVRALRDYDPDRPFSPWLYAIVRNVARSHVRDRSRRSTLAPVVSIEAEPRSQRRRDPVVAGDLERALESLAPMQQACLRLCDVEGFTSVEAARMLDLHEGTVRTHLHRARQKLRAALGSAGGMLR